MKNSQTWRQRPRGFGNLARVLADLWVGVEADKARACLEEAFNQGINFIDTANVYGRGAAETFLGEALRGGRATPTCSRPSSISR